MKKRSLTHLVLIMGILLATCQVHHAQTRTRLLLLGNDQFFMLKKDLTKEVKKTFKGYLTIKKDSVYIHPKAGMQVMYDSTLYAAVHKDSIQFKMSYYATGRSDCDDIPNADARQTCKERMERIFMWQSDYMDYELKNLLLAELHAPYSVPVTIYGFTLKAIYKQGEEILPFFTFSFQGNTMGRIFSDACLNYDPTAVSIELSEIEISLGGSSKNRFIYPGTVITSLKK